MTVEQLIKIMERIKELRSYDELNEDEETELENLLNTRLVTVEYEQDR